MKIFLLIFSIFLVCINCSKYCRNAGILMSNSSYQSSGKVNYDKELAVKDVKFDFDKEVFSIIKSSVIAAAPLENKDDKPDYVQSKKVNFQIAYKNPKKPPAEISVYKIEEYKKAFALVPRYVEMMKENFADLQKVLDSADKMKSFGTEQLPFVPFVDAHQEVFAKAKIINFKSGKGLIFLTQIVQNPVIINNEDLVYIFQGISTDERYFIYAEFPVSAEGLPETDTGSFENYKMPPNFYGQEDDEQFKAHENYRNNIASRLDNLQSAKFSPNLDKIENLTASIEIK